MSVTVAVKFELASKHTHQHPSAEPDQHDGDRKFEACFKPAGNTDLENNDEQTCKGKRQGVADSPENTNPAASPKALRLADKRRDGDNVIGVRGVFQSEQQTQPEHNERLRLKQ